MPARILPENGARYGRWTYLGEYSARQWKCQCDCGLLKWVQSDHIRSGRSRGCRSCGAITHGATGTKLYAIWTGIKTRCLNECHDTYPGYGGRGIRLAEAWRDFSVFAADVGQPPSEVHTIDRIDNNGHYEPGNVKWSVPKQQARNRRDNHWLTINGRTMVVTDWCKEAGITPPCAYNRVKERGWSWERAVTTPPQDPRDNLLHRKL